MTTSPEPAHETAAAADDAALTFRGVDQVSLTVTNLNVSARFYTQVLASRSSLTSGTPWPACTRQPDSCFR